MYQNLQMLKEHIWMIILLNALTAFVLSMSIVAVSGSKIPRSCSVYLELYLNIVLMPIGNTSFQISILMSAPSQIVPYPTIFLTVSMSGINMSFSHIAESGTAMLARRLVRPGLISKNICSKTRVSIRQRLNYKQ